MERRVSAAPAARMDGAAMKTTARMKAAILRLMGILPFETDLLPKLFVESLAVQFLDEAIIIKRFGFCFFRFRISHGCLIQDFLDGFPAVVRNLVHIIERVLMNGI